MARKIVSDIIEGLDIIARNYDHYEFGLPMFSENAIQQMEDKIESILIDGSFAAILSKNDIARELKKETPNIHIILRRLVAIEEYIGQGNQPSVMDIFTSLTDI